MGHCNDASSSYILSSYENIHPMATVINSLNSGLCAFIKRVFWFFAFCLFLSRNCAFIKHILKSTGLFQSRGLISTDEIGQPFVNISEH